ncbi:hypothetical protein F5880DRAFT_1559686 [Lentinula raphanica]|nr:hypothetical protein F5880DRAFT_1559686 [Lentinula raphanica]
MVFLRPSRRISSFGLVFPAVLALVVSTFTSATPVPVPADNGSPHLQQVKLTVHWSSNAPSLEAIHRIFPGGVSELAHEPFRNPIRYDPESDYIPPRNWDPKHHVRLDSMEVIESGLNADTVLTNNGQHELLVCDWEDEPMVYWAQTHDGTVDIHFIAFVLKLEGRRSSRGRGRGGSSSRSSQGRAQWSLDGILVYSRAHGQAPQAMFYYNLNRETISSYQFHDNANAQVQAIWDLLEPSDQHADHAHEIEYSNTHMLPFE